MTEPIDQLTLEAMESAAMTQMAIMRANGIQIPNDKATVAIFKLAFSAGAAWLAAYNVREDERRRKERGHEAH